MSRVAAALRVRAAVARHRGTARHCPVCEHSFDVFKDAWNRPDALCWRCGAHERHRAQMLFLQRRPELLGRAGALMHFAPEWCLARRLRTTPGLRYVTGDLDPAGVDLRLDVTALDIADDAYGAVICSHVLEHVEDDATAMRELRRITRPGGWVLVMVPIALDRDATYEDPAITDPADREREFRQADHVRLYAPDIAGRLRDAGFDVEVVDMTAEVGAEAATYQLEPSDLIFLCRS